MAAVKPKVKKDDVVGAPPWMVTYGDMMTLLLCFFILLYSMSTLEVIRFEQAAGSLRANLGVMPQFQSEINTEAVTEFAEPTFGIRWEVAEPGVEVTSVRIEGTRITIGGKVAFDEGSYVLEDRIKSILRGLAERLRGLQGRIEIRGHANYKESAVMDEMDLSYRRARAVRDYLITIKVDPHKMRVSGMSYFDPEAVDPSGRKTASNRHVTIVSTEEEVF